MQLNDRIREAFRSTGLTQSAFAAKIGVSKGAVSQWLGGANNDLRAANAQAIEALTGFRATWLISGKGEKLATKDGEAPPTPSPAGPPSEESNVSEGPAIRGLYPLISEVQAGMWTELCDNLQPGDAEDWLPSTKDLGGCGYMLRVKGKSMENPGSRISFPEGMVLHVKAQTDPVPGDFVIVRREGTGQATFKKFVMIDGHPYLEAINPDWPKELKYLPMQPGDTWCGVVVDASLGGLSRT